MNGIDNEVQKSLCDVITSVLYAHAQKVLLAISMSQAQFCHEKFWIVSLRLVFFNNMMLQARINEMNKILALHELDFYFHEKKFYTQLCRPTTCFHSKTITAFSWII